MYFLFMIHLNEVYQIINVLIIFANSHLQTTSPPVFPKTVLNPLHSDVISNEVWTMISYYYSPWLKKKQPFIINLCIWRYFLIIFLDNMQCEFFDDRVVFLLFYPYTWLIDIFGIAVFWKLINCWSLPYPTALAGSYVNFGVFELYGDRALSDALDIALKMALSIPLADILAYRKVCFCLCTNHIAVTIWQFL